MANNFQIKVDGLSNGENMIKKFGVTAQKGVDRALKDFGQQVATTAKQLTPVDEGRLRNSITSKFENGTVEIVAAADYAAYIEFGTRKFAAAYVATLPSDWQTFARDYKGRGDGNFKDFLIRIVEWVRRKGITGTYSTKATYSVKTRKRNKARRLGSKLNQFAEDYAAAYPIALSILREGIPAQPYLYPAYQLHRDELIKDLKAIFTK